jgi:hypothetical protein
LVCDDLGSETADFIAIDETRRRVAVIHCKAASKASSPDSVGASDFHEVVSQAAKNMGVLDLAGGFIPDRKSKWSRVWMKKPNFPRLRITPDGSKGKKGVGNFARVLLDLLRATDVRREVWLVLGNSISAGAAVAAAKQDTPPAYELVQLLYLLNSLHAITTSFGGVLHVFTGN